MDDNTLNNDNIQVMHEMTMEGYRLTAYKKTGEFIFTWLMDATDALNLSHTMSNTLVEHYNNVINIVKENTRGTE